MTIGSKFKGFDVKLTSKLKLSLKSLPWPRLGMKAWLGLPALAAALVGCAAMGPQLPPEQLVAQLAAARWEALVAQDFDKAYTLAAPSFRQVTNADAYKKKRQGVPVKWLSAKVLRVQCEEKKCDVRISLESKPIVPFTYKGTIASGLDETWVLEGGKWWFLESL